MFAKLAGGLVGEEVDGDEVYAQSIERHRVPSTSQNCLSRPCGFIFNLET